MQDALFMNQRVPQKSGGGEPDVRAVAHGGVLLAPGADHSGQEPVSRGDSRAGAALLPLKGLEGVAAQQPAEGPGECAWPGQNLREYRPFT